MKINVFGDSFAEREGRSEIWWKVLGSEFGHEIISYGESGSSILFSAKLLEQYHDQADLNIWCLTSPGRFSFKNSHNQNLHWNGASFSYNSSLRDDHETKEQKTACENYVKYLYDSDDDVFLSEVMVKHHQRKSNVMIVPCFSTPLNTDFFLKSIALMEVQHYLPGYDMEKFHKNYFELRTGHMSKLNNRILAEQINKNLRPGIFQTRLDVFQKPTEPFETLFRKR